ncbi:nicotinamide riboside kinase 1 isoform X1 [Phycodurus eques]|uniref:nicotinamide riboside kinase 1 isoform X1 n=1 Tax=Phycodurus eques TaxID=693459 RepID=UPI002ACD752C|nr:nicotinamide riboside kinase 1 isoform X1 [Phycodurus eques]
MKTLIVGVGGMTNGGKSTLSKTLQEKIPTSCIIAQDSFFKDDSVVPVDDNGFKQYDTLDALHMDAMMSRVDAWRRDPQAFLRETGQTAERMTLSADHVFVLIVEGFLIFNHRPLNELMDKRYFMEIPYDICKDRRSLRVYKPPDPPGYFDGHVWPMYLKNRQKIEHTVVGIVFLDGMKSKEELMAVVFQDVSQEINMLRGELPSRIEEGASIISSAPNELEDLSGMCT